MPFRFSYHFLERLSQDLKLPSNLFSHIHYTLKKNEIHIDNYLTPNLLYQVINLGSS